MIQQSNQVRIVALALIFTGVVGTLGQLLLFPKEPQQGQSRPGAFVFPPAIELPEWQLEFSRSIDPKTLSEAARQRFIAGQIYTYQQGNRSLTITMAYVVDTNGRASNFLEGYTSIPPKLALSTQRIERYREQAGHYLLFQDQGRAYLTSCINPRGESTVTLEQFQQNRYRQDIRPDRLVRWFFNSESLRDFRCLWVNFSMPIQNNSPEETFSTLEKVWFPWKNWWQPQFPRL